MLRIWRNEKGSAMVEFALVIMLFLMLFMGLVEFGRIFHALLTLDNAARHGARVAAIGSSDTQIIAAVKNAAPQLVIRDADITIEASPRTRLNPITVTVRTKIHLIVPIISGLLQNPFPVQGQATMMLEV
jgi:Flp pilus assembly protein TadG